MQIKIKFLLFFLLFSFFLPVKTYASETPQVVVINQVRGQECCDKGSFENLKIQINTSIKNIIPATWAIRYDALTDNNYKTYLKEQFSSHPALINLGVLFEITPNLARDSGVVYKGNAESWFGAENLFSIGYSDEENKKIADRLFSTFFSDFGFYPNVNVSWMINTNLLNYLKDKYKIKVQEITREQVGTDSYTLDGGPPHYPYPASKNWLFIPDYGNSDSTLIVRQTVTDPLYNFGDKTSSYTSQPNDYGRNKDFTYFEGLIKKALFDQNQTGFALLGLENSMDSKYQREYIKQLDLIKSYKDRGLITFPSIEQAQVFWNTQQISLYQSPNESYWITTPTYRIRLRAEKEKVFISDIRVYNSGFSDPYQRVTATREGFWIAPFLLNGLVQPKATEDKFQIIKPQPMPENNFYELTTDVDNNSSRIDLPQLKGKISITQTSNEINLSYESVKGKIAFVFTGSEIEISGVNKNDFKFNDNFPKFYPIKRFGTPSGFDLTWNGKNGILAGLNTRCSIKCKITFTSNPDSINIERINNYEYLLPEPANHPIDVPNTIVYPNNKYAIAGRNPVRIIVIPYDKFGLVTTLPNETQIRTEDSLQTQKITQGKRYFFDVISTSPRSEKVTFNFGKGTKNLTVYFAPNCKNDIKFCITNPKYLWWYTQAIVGDKFRQIF